MPARRRATVDLSPPPGGLADGPALNAGALSDDVRFALQQLEDIQQLAAAGACHVVTLCEALTEAARALASVQAHGLAESCLAQAQHGALLLSAPDLRANLLCARAEVAIQAAELARWRGDARDRGDEARSSACRHAHAAAALAGGTSDPQCELKLLLRASDVLDRCGQHDEALQLQQRAMLLLGLHSPAAIDATALPAHPAHDALQLAAPTALM